MNEEARFLRYWCGLCGDEMVLDLETVDARERQADFGRRHRRVFLEVAA